MKRITSTKINVIILSLILVGIVCFSAYSRTITDNSDDIVTYITNSNGGVWNATAANLQNAIDDLSTGGMVYLPSGTISVTTTLNISGNNLVLSGVGGSTRLICADSMADEILECRGGSDILIENIWFDGDSDNQASAVPLVLLSDEDGTSVENVTFQNCIFTNSTSSMIRSEDSDSLAGCDVNNVRVSNCRFEHLKHISGYPAGVWISGDGWVVENCYFKDTNGSGVVIEDTATDNEDSAYNNLVTGCTFTGKMDYGVYCEGFASGTQKSKSNVISDCWFLDMEDTSVYSSAEGAVMLRDNDIVSDCHFYNLVHLAIKPEGVCLITDCIIDKVDGTAIDTNADSFVTISNTVITNVTRYAIYMNGNGTIEGCRIEDTNTDQASRSAIHIHTYPVSVLDTTILNCYKRGIWTQADNTTIIGCRLDNIITVSDAYGIYLDSCNDCVITGNTITNTATGVKESGTSDYTNLIGNNLRGCTTAHDVNAGHSVATYNIGADTDTEQDGYAYDGKIHNSNGNSWTANASNLQSAIDDLNNESGWVDGGNNEITISDTIKLGTECEMRNVKLVLADNADVTMIMNYDISNGNDGIWIHDVELEGNGEEQTYEDAETGLMHTHPAGIFLIKGDNHDISNVIVNNTQFGGIFIQQSFNSRVRDCTVNNAGAWLDEDALSETDYYCAVGIYLYNTTNSTINNCFVNHVWSAGIVVESTLPSDNPHRNYYTTVSDCIVTDSTIAFYCEDAERVTFTGNHAYETSLKNENFSVPVGFFAKEDTTSDIKYIGNTVVKCPKYGFSVGSNYSLISGNTFIDCREAISLAGAHNSVVTSNIIRDTYWGIQSGTSSYNVTVTNNLIEDSYTSYWGWTGTVGINVAGFYDSFFMLNTILDIEDYGVRGSNGDNGNVVILNRFENVGTELYQVADRVNCTGYDDWNFYDGVS